MGSRHAIGFEDWASARHGKGDRDLQTILARGECSNLASGIVGGVRMEAELSGNAFEVRPCKKSLEGIAVLSTRSEAPDKKGDLDRTIGLSQIEYSLPSLGIVDCVSESVGLKSRFLVAVGTDANQSGIGFGLLHSMLLHSMRSSHLAMFAIRTYVGTSCDGRCSSFSEADTELRQRDTS
mmetsp:Transcript_88586/g.138639  ORF Transcript_88586/g.138639 Transcript_88586/m.138639 type:complete len:180 (-) Transcript_88586:297-836(-)